MAKIDYCWRALATGLCFFVFGTLSLLCSITILPLLTAWPGDAETRQRRVRNFAGASFRLLLATIRILGLGRVNLEGDEWLASADGKLVVATHPMYLDVVALLSLLPQADCVVKGAMYRNPFYRRFIKAAGYFSNADSSQLLENCVGSLREGRTLILFPEGTRSEPGKPLRFRRGAAQVAVRSHCDILPVLIHCSPPTLAKHARWYQVPRRRWRLQIRFYPPQSLATAGLAEDLPHGVAARRLTHHLETFFTTTKYIP